MDYQLTREEETELKQVARGLRTNEKLPHDKAALASLIEKGLLKRVGIGVRLTPEGEILLRRL